MRTIPKTLQESFLKVRDSLLRQKKTGFVVALAIIAIALGAYAVLPAPTAQGALKGRRVEIHKNALIKVLFDQEMNHASVESAFRISPAAAGSFAWDRNMLTFTPAQHLEKGSTYDVVIGEGARNRFGKGLKDVFRQSFVILDYPEVTVAAPADKTEIGQSQVLTVLFDHPIRTLSRQVVAPQLLKIEPPVPGITRWLGTSGLEFVPENGWPAATDFTVTIPKGMKMADGSELVADYTWSFGTPRLRADQTMQYYSSVGRTQSITVEFNYPVTAEAVRNAITPQEDGKPYPKDRVRVTQDPKRPNVVVISPQDAWSLGKLYAFVFPDGFTGGVGSKGMSGWAPTLRTDDVGFTFVNANVSPDERLDVSYNLSFRFNNPIDASTTNAGIVIDPKPKELSVYVPSYEPHAATIYAKWDPSTKYSVTLTSKLKDRNGQPLKEEKRIAFETNPYRPSAALASYADHGMLAAHLPRVFQLRALNLTQPVKTSLCSGSFEDYVLNKEFACAIRGEKTYATEAKPNTYKIINIDLDDVAGSRLPNGVYKLTAELPDFAYDWEKVQTRTLLVTDIALTVKRDDAKKILVWATDMKTGDVIPNLPIDVFVTKEDALTRIANGKTDARGLVFLTLPDDVGGSLAVRATDGTRLGFTWSDWDDGITPWNYGLEPSWSRRIGAHIGYLYTDRRIYRPDHTVQFKGVVRRDVDAKLSIPSVREVTVMLFDPEEQQIETQKLPLSAYGTFHGAFTLNPDMKLGTYRFSATVGDEAESRIDGTFDVREYRRPDFKIEVSTPEGVLTSGQKIRIPIHAEYFHGAPLANAKVNYQVTRNSLYFQPMQGEWYSYNSIENYDCYWECRAEANFEPVVTGDAELDANGNLAIDVPANLTDYKSSATYYVTVNVTDVNQRVVSANADFPVHKGEFYMGIRANYEKGWDASIADFDIVSVNVDGSVRPNIPATVKFVKRSWANVQKVGIDGTTSWEYTPQDSVIGTAAVTTDATGKAFVSFTPKEDGEFLAIVEAKDGRGNVITASAYRYVYRGYESSVRVSDDHQMRIVQNKADYVPGEIASLAVQTPYENTKALVTVERETIRDYRVIDLGMKNRTITVPITEDAAPNIFVSVLAVKGGDAVGIPEFRMGMAKLQVKTANKVLNVNVTTDKSVYRPRDPAMVQIETKRADGSPVSAEVSVAVVDERTVTLLGSIDKNILGRFWFPRTIGVWTSQSLTRLVKKIFFETGLLEGDGKGAGGSDVAAIRGNFLDTAYWKADVVTGPDGKATVQFNFPDNLTSWQILVIGATKDTIVGAAEAKVMTRRDLMVEPLLPRILRHGDTAVVGATVFNGTEKSLSIDVHMATDGVAIKGAEKRTVTLGPKSRQAVHWTVQAPLKGGSVKFTVTAKANGLADGFVQPLPLLPNAVAEVVSAAGLLERTVTETLEPPEDIRKDVGDVSVTVSPNVGNGLSGGVDYLVNFPYGCSEQTTSAVLAALSYNELVEKKITKPDDALLAQGKAKVEEGVKRLVAMQRADGGWGLWPEATDSAPHYTAYVFWGLTRVARAGFTVDPIVLNRADAYLRSSLSAGIDTGYYEQLNANERAQVLFMLSERDPRDLAGYVASLYEKRDLLTGFGKSFLAMALGNVEPYTSSARAATLLKDVQNKIVRLDPSRVYISEDSGYDWYWSTDTRTTAIYLQALLRLDPKNRDIEPLVRYLMTKRRSGYWESTQNTAMAMLALAEYAKAHPLQTSPIDVEVYLQNESLGILSYPEGDVSSQKSKIIPLPEILKKGALVQIGLEKDTDNRYFYDIAMKTYRDVEQIEPFENGFSITSEIYALTDKKLAHPLSEVAQGDTIRMKLKVVVPKERRYVALESHLPAGLEAVDFALKTSPQSLAGETKQCAPTWWGGQSCFSDQEYGWWWENVWKHIEFRDDRVFLFSEDLRPGVYEYEFLALAVTPGTFRLPPAQIYEFYNPQMNAHNEGKTLTVTAK